MKRTPLDLSAQILLPCLTISGQLVVGLKYPQWGLIINLAAQPFWIYSSWKAYKEAKQVGIMITTIIMTTVTAFGVINYWFIK